MGGRRKSRRKPPPKKTVGKLDTVFTCPLCNEERSVVCHLNKQTKQGEVECLKCGKKHSYRITALSAPVDVYAEWIEELSAFQKANDQKRIRELREHGLASPSSTSKPSSITTTSATSATATATTTVSPGMMGDKRPRYAMSKSLPMLGKRSMRDEDDEEEEEYGDEGGVADEMRDFIEDDENDNDDDDD